MIKKIIVLFLICVSQSCVRTINEGQVTSKDIIATKKDFSVITKTKIITQESKSILTNQDKCFTVKEKYTWFADVDENGNDYLIRGGRLDEIKDDYTKIIYEINK